MKRRKVIKSCINKLQKEHLEGLTKQKSIIHYDYYTFDENLKSDPKQ